MTNLWSPISKLKRPSPLGRPEQGGTIRLNRTYVIARSPMGKTAHLGACLGIRDCDIVIIETVEGWTGLTSQCFDDLNISMLQIET